jgi:hypothetical protein
MVHASPDFGIASFLIFVLIVVLLCIANTLESRAIRRKGFLTLAKPLALLSITEAFDPIYSVLWEVPLAALELIDSAGTRGIPVARLRPIYDDAAVRFPEIYDRCSFLQWLQFMEEAEFISWHTYRLVLTPDGQAFLRFRFVTDAMVEA